MSNRSEKVAAAGFAILGAAVAAVAARRRHDSHRATSQALPAYPPVPQPGWMSSGPNRALDDVDREMANIEKMQQGVEPWTGPVPTFDPTKPLPGSHTSGPYAVLDDDIKRNPKGQWR